MKKLGMGFVALLMLLSNAVSVAAAATPLVANGGFETGTAAPSSWNTSWWGVLSAKFTYAASGHAGGRSAQVTVSNYMSGDAKWYYDAIAVTPGSVYNYTDWYKSTAGNSVGVAVTSTTGATSYYWLGDPAVASGWTKTSYTFTMPQNAKTALFTHYARGNGVLTIDDVAVSTNATTGSASTTPAPTPKPSATQFARPLVSLTFDDGWRNIYTNGLPLLKKYNLPSTQYLLTGTTAYPGYMTVDMMKEFQAQGSEIASHTVNHPDITTLSSLTLDGELKNSQDSLRGWMGAGVATNFASPYGAYNATAVTAIQKYYRSHRSVETGYNTKTAFNIYDIKVQNIYNTTKPSDVQAWVAQAAANKSWLVLVYHEVNAAAADPTYAVTPANLDAELAIVKQSGLPVVTVQKALDEIVPQL